MTTTGTPSLGDQASAELGTILANLGQEGPGNEPGGGGRVPPAPTPTGPADQWNIEYPETDGYSVNRWGNPGLREDDDPVVINLPGAIPLDTNWGEFAPLLQAHNNDYRSLLRSIENGDNIPERQRLIPAPANRNTWVDRPGVATPPTAPPPTPPGPPVPPAPPSGDLPDGAEGMMELLRRIDGRTNGIETTVNDLVPRFGDLERAVDGLGTRVGTVEGRLNQLVDGGVEAVIAEAASHPEIIANAVEAGVNRAVAPIQAQLEGVETLANTALDTANQAMEAVTELRDSSPSFVATLIGMVAGGLLGLVIAGMFNNGKDAVLRVGQTTAKASLTNHTGVLVLGLFVGALLGAVAGSMFGSLSRTRSRESTTTTRTQTTQTREHWWQFWRPAATPPAPPAQGQRDGNTGAQAPAAAEPAPPTPAPTPPPAQPQAPVGAGAPAA